ncbi:MAG: GntR family transcriptional regulator, partial [Butyrivibrio sp.]|nr:GntR family transcriptional regulator [Butyrivibrio sp.]
MIAEINFVDKGEGVSLRDMVYFELKEAIMRGELAPGLRLMEIPIAERLGVSRTPVREAVKRLEEDGLVIITPGCGAKVSEIRGKDVTDALDVRIVVETMAVRLAAKNISAGQVDELKRINAEMRRAIMEKNTAALS